MNLGFYGIFYSGLERWRHLFLRLSSVIKYLLSINGTQAYEFIHGKVENSHEIPLLSISALNTDLKKIEITSHLMLGHLHSPGNGHW